MPTNNIETDQLLVAASQMSSTELEQFVNKLFAIKVKKGAPSLPAKELELLQKINQGFPPATFTRMQNLIAKRQSRTISDKELQELIGITDEVERVNVERIKYLIELAALRNLTLDKLMDQLGIKPSPNLLNEEQEVNETTSELQISEGLIKEYAGKNSSQKGLEPEKSLTPRVRYINDYKRPQKSLIKGNRNQNAADSLTGT
ncbi:MAG: hypothetical protein AB1757_13180 [Acidobacteriota bacterium]